LKKNFQIYFPYFLIFLTAFLTFGLYLNSCFVYDDIIYLVKNFNIKIYSLDLISLQRAMFGLKFEATRPVFFLTLALNYYVFGLSSFAFHLINLLIHILNGCLLFHIFWKTNNYLEEKKCDLFSLLAVVILWAVHPIQIMSVMYTSARSETLSLFFSLLSMECYILFRRSVIDNKKAWFKFLYAFFSFLLCILAVFSKEIAVLIIPVILFYEVIFLQKEKKYFLKKTWSYFLLLLIPAFILTLASQFIFGKTIISHYRSLNAEYLIPISDLVPAKLSVVWKYAELLFAPFASSYALEHHIVYGQNLHTYMPGLTVLFVLAAIFLYALRKRDQMMTFGMIIFLIPFGFYLLPFPLRLVDEYRLYFALSGFVLTFVCFLNHFLKRFHKGVLIILIGVLIFFSHARLGEWYSPVNLWKLNHEKYPLSFRAAMIYGRELVEAGEAEKGLHILKKAESLSENNAEIFYQMGVAWMKAGDDKKALENFQKAIKINPKMDKAISQSGVIFAMSSQLEEAMKYFKKAIAVFPSDYQNYKQR